MKIKIFVIIFTALFTSSVYSQNIVNTLGSGGAGTPGGVFYIKNSSTNFFTLHSSTGNVTLSNNLMLSNSLNSTLGVIYKGNSNFIHNYSPSGSFGRNTFVGVDAGNFSMTANTSIQASNNTGIGYVSLEKLTTGYYNTAVGAYTLNFNTTGFQNTSLGYYTLTVNTTGFANTAVGSNALNLNSSGSANTGIGNSAGSTITTGKNLTCIGNGAQASSPTAENEITFGDINVLTLRSNVSAITSLSDERDKKNIKNLQFGIDFIMKLKPRQFNWDKREWYENNTSDGSKMQSAPTAGFIAQELDRVQIVANSEWLNLVLKENPERIEATTGNLLPIIVKAIQDLKKENDELKERLLEFEEMKLLLVKMLEGKSSNKNRFSTVSLGE